MQDIQRIRLTKPYDGKQLVMEIDPIIGEQGIKDQIQYFVQYGVDVGRRQKRYKDQRRFRTAYSRRH